MKKFSTSRFENFPRELAVLKKLRTPAAVQDFLNAIPLDFEKSRSMHYYSPLATLQRNKALCMDGALFAAAALWCQGRPPLILDLKTTEKDVDHVIALFKEGNKWGALSKTNHAVLRYRDAIYRDPRELVMSYFNEYFLDNGKKTLRSYSAVPLDLSTFDDEWLATDRSLDDIVEALDFAHHTNILNKKETANLRGAEPIEIAAGKIIEWKNGKGNERKKK